jgi:hypothetical protein
MEKNRHLIAAPALHTTEIECIFSTSMKRPSEASAGMTQRGSWNLYKNQILTFLLITFTLTMKNSRNHHNWEHFADVGSQMIDLAGDSLVWREIWGLVVVGDQGLWREISRHLAGGGNAVESSRTIKSRSVTDNRRREVADDTRSPENTIFSTKHG